MDASLKLEEPAGGPLENLLQYPDLGALSVVANLHGPRSAEHVASHAPAPESCARDAQGSIDLNRESADLTYSLDAPAMTPRPGLSWQRIALQGRWQGPLTAPHAQTGNSRSMRCRVPGGAELAALNANLNADRGDLAVHATAEGLVLPGPQPRLLADSPIARGRHGAAERRRRARCSCAAIIGCSRCRRAPSPPERRARPSICTCPTSRRSPRSPVRACAARASSKER